MGVVGEYDLGKIALRIKLFFFISEKRKTRGGGGNFHRTNSAHYDYFIHSREKTKKKMNTSHQEKKKIKKNKQFLGFLPQYTSNVTEQKNILLFLIFQEKKKARGLN